MARPKKNGKRANGIQGRSGQLYIVTSHPTIKNGIRIREKRWTATGLADIPENIKKASEIRKKLLESKVVPTIDRNISMDDFTDYILGEKKREVTDTTYSSYFYRAKRIKDYFGIIKVRDVNETMVKDFLDDLFEAYHMQYRTVKDIKVFLGNMFEALPADREYDMIISNPPYVRTADIDNLSIEVRDHEPKSALDGGKDGLDFYRIIAKDASMHLRSGGVMVLEIGADQAGSVKRLLMKNKAWENVRKIQDMAGLDRAIIAERK